MASTEQPHTCILIVDDNADVRESLAEVLEDEAYPVATAANGLEAMQYLRNHPTPCLILLDLLMPVMDGWEFRSQQKQDPALAQIPVVIVSGADRAEQKSGTLDAVRYFVKPVDLSELLATVADYC